MQKKYNQIKLIEALSEAQPQKNNEDLIYASSELAIVIDGATPLSSSPWKVYDFVERFLSILVFSWEENRDFIAALNQTHKKLLAIYPDKNKNTSPSLGFVAIAVEKDKPNAYWIGDCRIYCGNNVNKAKQLSSLSRLDKLDRLVLEILNDYLSMGIPLKKSYEMIKPILAEHRKLLNQPFGYPIFSLNNFDISSVRKQTVSLGDFLLCSDGFYCGFEGYDITTIDEIFQKKYKLSNIFRLLREVEVNDKECILYPRFKQHDDASAILLSIS